MIGLLHLLAAGWGWIAAQPFGLKIGLGLLLLVAGSGPRSRKLAAALLAPILEGGRVSLGRMSMCVMVWAIVWLVVRQPGLFVAISWPATVLIVFVFLVLACYCYGQKPHMVGYFQALIERMPMGGQAPEQVAQIVQKVEAVLPGAKAPAAADADASGPSASDAPADSDAPDASAPDTEDAG